MEVAILRARASVLFEGDFGLAGVVIGYTYKCFFSSSSPRSLQSPPHSHHDPPLSPHRSPRTWLHFRLEWGVKRVSSGIKKKWETDDWLEKHKERVESSSCSRWKNKTNAETHIYTFTFATCTQKRTPIYTYHLLGRGKKAKRRKNTENVIQSVTLIFSVEMHTHAHTQTQCNWPSHFLRRVPFSLSLFMSLLLLSVAVVIKLAFLSFLCFPRRLDKRWGPQRQKKVEREREKKQERKMLTKEDIKRKRKKAWESRGDKEIESRVWQAEKEEGWEDKDRKKQWESAREKKKNTASGQDLWRELGGKYTLKGSLSPWLPSPVSFAVQLHDELVLL